MKIMDYYPNEFQEKLSISQLEAKDVFLIIDLLKIALVSTTVIY